MTSPFEAVGGMDGLRAILTDFYDMVFDDVMIGFHFKDANKARLIEKEAEFAAKMLGATHVPYTGKSIPAAHAKHPILGGQFERRLKLLIDAMDRHEVPDDVKTIWIEHTRALRGQVTRDQGSDCNHLENPPTEGFLLKTRDDP